MNPTHPFKESNPRTEQVLLMRRQASIWEWEEYCRVLRANPGLPVFLQSDQAEPHVCGETGSLMRLGCACGDCGTDTPLSYCRDCERVGVVWDPDWVVPDDLADRVDAASSARPGPKPVL